MKICPKCKKEVKEDAEICKFCRNKDFLTKEQKEENESFRLWREFFRKNRGYVINESGFFVKGKNFII